MKTNVNVIWMHCASCASIIEKKVKKFSWVNNVVVNVVSNTASIDYDEKEINIDEINQELRKYGYEIERMSEDEKQKILEDNGEACCTLRQGKKWGTKELQKLKKSVFFLLPLSLFFFLLMIHHSFVKLGLLEMWNWEKYLPEIGFITSSIVLFGFWQKFIKAFFRFCRHWVANMDTLVWLWAGVAYFYSAFIFLFPKILDFLGKELKTYNEVIIFLWGTINQFALETDIYFEAVIIIIGFITFWDYLVANSKAKTGEALKKLLNLQAKTATILKGWKEIEISIEKLKVWDIFLVKPWEKIAVDWEIISWESSIDESMISWEPLAVHKKIWDTVVWATINKNWSLQVKAIKVWNDTMLSQIIKAVWDAQNSKAPIQNLADKIVSVFVPVVLVIAFLSLIIWSLFWEFNGGFVSFIAILVVACPCAMWLATPMAVTIWVWKSALNWILVKNAESLQKLSKINFVVFDKTGTITEGKMKVTKENLRKDEWNILYSLEKMSNHPLAESIVNYAEKNQKVKRIEIKKFKNLEWLGIEWEINWVKYWAGNSNLAEKFWLSVKNSWVSKTEIFFGNTDKVLWNVHLQDSLKKEAKSLIQDLHKFWIKTAILTWDKRESALEIWYELYDKKLITDEIIAEVLPSDKAKEIKKLQEKGFKVAMVWDGINDAIALTQADVWIAMWSWTDIAIESADITLLGWKIEHLITSIRIAKATMKTIKQNLFFSFFYNSVAIPIAAWILYPFFGILLNPAIEWAAMVFSSVSVVLNSLRLRK